MNRGALALALFLLSCSTAAPSNRQAIIESATHYKETHLPEVIYDPRQPRVFDDGENWRVAFKGPPDAVGGGAVVWVNKKTGKAVRILGLQ